MAMTEPRINPTKSRIHSIIKNNASLNCIFLFLKIKIVIRDTNEIRTIISESGSSFSITSKPLLSVDLTILAKVIFIIAPE